MGGGGLGQRSLVSRALPPLHSESHLRGHREPPCQFAPVPRFRFRHQSVQCTAALPRQEPELAGSSRMISPLVLELRILTLDSSVPRNRKRAASDDSRAYHHVPKLASLRLGYATLWLNLPYTRHHIALHNSAVWSCSAVFGRIQVSAKSALFTQSIWCVVVVVVRFGPRRVPRQAA